MAEQILVPYDGSDPAGDALRYVFERYPDPEVTVCHVISIPEGYWSAFEDEPTDLPRYEKAKEAGEATVADAVAIAEEYDATIDTELVPGAPAETIVERAAEEDVDLVVIGSHGRKGVSRILLGSVAERVVQRAPVPVLVVR